jgi:hypothetical protein
MIDKLAIIRQSLAQAKDEDHKPRHNSLLGDNFVEKRPVSRLLKNSFARGSSYAARFSRTLVANGAYDHGKSFACGSA